MKQYRLFFILTAAFATSLFNIGCYKDSINNDPKSLISATPGPLFTLAEKSLVDHLTTPSVNVNVFRLIIQHWTETTYTDESNYNFTTRNLARGWWNPIYRDVLKNLDVCEGLLPSSVTNSIELVNDSATVEVLTVMSYYYLITTFGDIPYTQALVSTNPSPVYDDAYTVYKKLIIRLNTAISKFNTTTSAWSGGEDILYNGSVTQWQKFANSLKFKMGLLLSDKDPALSKSTCESAFAAGLFTSSSDNAVFAYLGVTPNTNPIYVQLVQSGRKDFVAGNTIIDIMNSFNDPRRALFFDAISTGAFLGGVIGANSSSSAYSNPAATMQVATFPGTILSYSEIQLDLAEAVELGYSVGGTSAQTFYDNGVTASITEWGGTTAAATTYLNQSSVNYLTASGTYKQKIGVQKYLALYNRGHDAWTEWRKLDFPNTLTTPFGVAVANARVYRLPYSDQEQTLNNTNYTAASLKIGGDTYSTKLFFDVY